MTGEPFIPLKILKYLAQGGLTGLVVSLPLGCALWFRIRSVRRRGPSESSPTRVCAVRSIALETGGVIVFFVIYAATIGFSPAYHGRVATVHPDTEAEGAHAVRLVEGDRIVRLDKDLHPQIQPGDNLHHIVAMPYVFINRGAFVDRSGLRQFGFWVAVLCVTVLGLEAWNWSGQIARKRNPGQPDAGP